MKIKTSIGVSNHHVHLTKEAFQQLFGKETITLAKSTKQPGQFAGEEKVAIRTAQGKLENLRVMGPFRPYCQVEITKTDAYQLKIDPPVRRSGDVNNAAEGLIVGPAGTITTNNIIIANRHVHVPRDLANEKNIIDDQTVRGIINNTPKKGTIELKAVVDDNYFYEIHLDMDDANAFLLKNGDEIDLDYEI